MQLFKMNEIELFEIFSVEDRPNHVAIFEKRSRQTFAVPVSTPLMTMTNDQYVMGENKKVVLKNEMGHEIESFEGTWALDTNPINMQYLLDPEVIKPHKLDLFNIRVEELHVLEKEMFSNHSLEMPEVTFKPMRVEVQDLQTETVQYASTIDNKTVLDNLTSTLKALRLFHYDLITIDQLMTEEIEFIEYDANHVRFFEKEPIRRNMFDGLRLTSSFPLRKMWELLIAWFRGQNNIRMHTMKGLDSFGINVDQQHRIFSRHRFETLHSVRLLDISKQPQYVPSSQIDGIQLNGHVISRSGARHLEVIVSHRMANLLQSERIQDFNRVNVDGDEATHTAFVLKTGGSLTLPHDDLIRFTRDETSLIYPVSRIQPVTSNDRVYAQKKITLTDETNGRVVFIRQNDQEWPLDVKTGLFKSDYEKIIYKGRNVSELRDNVLVDSLHIPRESEFYTYRENRRGFKRIQDTRNVRSLTLSIESVERPIKTPWFHTGFTKAVLEFRRDWAELPAEIEG